MKRRKCGAARERLQIERADEVRYDVIDGLLDGDFVE
jgi:hypothetical protein